MWLQMCMVKRRKEKKVLYMKRANDYNDNREGHKLILKKVQCSECVGEFSI